MPRSEVSSPVIKRLPRYYRFLGELKRQGVIHISSRELYEKMGLTAANKTILIGAGNLGRAITAHIDFPKRGFELVGIFDNDPNICGKKMRGIEVMNISDAAEFCRKNSPVCAILCIPKEAAKTIVPELIDNGIKAFWNFSHYEFNIAENKHIIVENVHLADSLMTLAYGLNNC